MQQRFGCEGKPCGLSGRFRLQFAITEQQRDRQTEGQCSVKKLERDWCGRSREEDRHRRTMRTRNAKAIASLDRRPTSFRRRLSTTSTPSRPIVRLAVRRQSAGISACNKQASPAASAIRPTVVAKRRCSKYGSPASARWARDRAIITFDSGKSDKGPTVGQVRSGSGRRKT